MNVKAALVPMGLTRDPSGRQSCFSLEVMVSKPKPRNGVAVIVRVEDIRSLLARGRTEPEAVFPEIRKLAASDQRQTREVAATALVEIGRRHPAAVLREAHRWAKARDANVRRAASEGLRGAVKLDPQAVLPVLEMLRADPDLHVKKSVANVLRNASAKHPDFVLSVCRQWAQSSNSHTRWIVKDGLRRLKGLRPREVALILGLVNVRPNLSLTVRSVTALASGESAAPARRLRPELGGLHRWGG